MRIAGTGHRPPKLGLGYDQESRALLSRFVQGQVVALGPISELISGGAQGFDQALADVALALGIPLTVAVPFLGMEDRWPDDAKRRFWDILDGATRVVIVRPGGYAARKFADRDRWMVDHADGVLALYDEADPTGGTAITVGYARERGRPVTNVWREWDGLRR